MTCLRCLFCDIDPKIITDPDGNKCRRCSVIFFLILLGMSSISVCITIAMFITRITPWYLRGNKKATIVWVLALAACVGSGLSIIMFFTFIGTLCKKKEIKCGFISFNFFTWLSFILTIVAYYKATESVVIPELNTKVLCSAPYYGCIDANEEDYEHSYYSDYDKFEKWVNKGIKYVCSSIMGPILFLAIAQFIIYIFFMLFVLCCDNCNCNKNKVGNECSTDNDDDMQRNYYSTPPNQNNENYAQPN